MEVCFFLMRNSLFLKEFTADISYLHANAILSNYFLVITVLAYNQFSPRTRECINCCLILSRNKITCLYNKGRNNTWREMVLDETGHTQV